MFDQAVDYLEGLISQEQTFSRQHTHFMDVSTILAKRIDRIRIGEPRVAEILREPSALVHGDLVSFLGKEVSNLDFDWFISDVLMGGLREAHFGRPEVPATFHRNFVLLLSPEMKVACGAVDEWLRTCARALASGGEVGFENVARSDLSMFPPATLYTAAEYLIGQTHELNSKPALTCRVVKGTLEVTAMVHVPNPQSPGQGDRGRTLGRLKQLLRANAGSLESGEREARVFVNLNDYRRSVGGAKG